MMKKNEYIHERERERKRERCYHNIVTPRRCFYYYYYYYYVINDMCFKNETALL